MENPGATLRTLVTQRHAAFAQEMLALFERTVAELQEEVRVLRAENQRQRRILEAAAKTKVPQKKAKRTNGDQSNTKPDLDLDGLTENSSDSEDDNWKQKNEPKEEDCDLDQNVHSETERQTENSSDSEVEGGWNKKSQSDTDAEGSLDLESDCQTENSSESEGEENGEMNSKPPAKKLKKEVVERKESPSVATRSLKIKKSTQKTSQKGPFMCSICNKSFIYKSVLKMHQEGHSNSRPFECSECGTSFTMKYRLDRHMEIHRRNKPVVTGCDNNPSIKCSSNSNAPTGNSAPLSEAANGTHTETDDNLKATTSPVSERPQCSHCGKFFATKGNLNKHLLIHKRSGETQCTMCKKRFLFKIQLQKHILQKHKPFEQKRIHQKPKTFDCSHCKQRYRHQRDLDSHMAAHRQKKRFKCGICDKLFRDRQYCEDHLGIHTGEKNHQCPVCDKRFTFRQSFKLHMKTHKELSAVQVVQKIDEAAQFVKNPSHFEADT